MRRPDVLLANDLVRGGYVLSQELPRRENGWKWGRRSLRTAVVQVTEDMDVPGWKLHQLKGALKGHWAVWVDGNWRLTFTFEGGDAVLVDYQDYH